MMAGVDAEHVAILREALAETRWLERSQELARALRRTREPGGLMLVGTPEVEPWHLAAHLDDECTFAGLPQLRPTLVRWQPPAHAPRHLRVGLDRLAETRRGETLFVVSPDEEAPIPLLERVDDARRGGATVLSVDPGDRELATLAHEAWQLPPGQAPLSLDGAQHLVSSAAGSAVERPSGFRDRISRLLDVISGPRFDE